MSTTKTTFLRATKLKILLAVAALCGLAAGAADHLFFPAGFKVRVLPGAALLKTDPDGTKSMYEDYASKGLPAAMCKFYKTYADAKRAGFKAYKGRKPENMEGLCWIAIIRQGDAEWIKFCHPTKTDLVKRPHSKPQIRSKQTPAVSPASPTRLVDFIFDEEFSKQPRRKAAVKNLKKRRKAATKADSPASVDSHIYGNLTIDPFDRRRLNELIGSRLIARLVRDQRKASEN